LLEAVAATYLKQGGERGVIEREMKQGVMHVDFQVRSLTKKK
jgi:hypothetical protein